MQGSSAASGHAKYFAFLSYSHKDAQAAAALSRYIEMFRVPIRLGGKEQQLPKRMFPVFRDRDEFSASSDLGSAIEDALAKSGALIVLCSPAAGQSKWVDEEIRAFRRTGNPKRVFPVLVEGEPSEAFPAALKESEALPSTVDLRRGRATQPDARLRLVAALLGVDYDALKQLETRRARGARLRAAAMVLGLIILAVIFPIALLLHLAAQPRFSDNPIPVTRDTDSYTRLGGGLNDWGPMDLTAGLDGAMWFTEEPVSIGRVVIGRSGQISITEYSVDLTSWVPAREPREGDAQYRRRYYSAQSQHLENGAQGPYGITAGPGGAVWFTIQGYPTDAAGFVGMPGFGVGRIGRATFHDGHVSISEYATPTVDSSPAGIAAGPGGGLWFTEYTADKIGRVTIASHGGVTITEYPVPTRGSGPDGITAGSHDGLWFTERDASQIGHVAVEPGGRIAITEYRTPTSRSQPSGITRGPGDEFWFTEAAASQVGRITIGRDGRVLITEYPTPTNQSQPQRIAMGSDGAAWFTETSANQIGRIDIGSSGRTTITEYRSPTGYSFPLAIAAGPDGAIWFVEENSNRVARVTPGFRFWR